MSGDRTGEFDRWWQNRQQQGSRGGTSPLRGGHGASSPRMPYQRTESPGLNRHHYTDSRDQWSPFRNTSMGGHGGTSPSHHSHRDPYQPSSYPQPNYHRQPQQSPRQPASPSPLRTRDPSPSPYSYDYGGHQSPRQHHDQYNWRRDPSPSRSWGPQQPLHPNPNHSVAAPLPMGHSHGNGHNESAITQVPQTGMAAPVFWPKEFLPPEPDPRTFTPLLPPKDRAFQSRNTLVLDLDETLVHSSFKPLTLVDMLLDIDLEEGPQTVYVRKRPYVEEFLARVCELYEVVVLTASLAVYADRVLDQLDPEGYWLHHRLFRDSCANLNGNYIKDLSYLGRPLHEVIIIDNSPTSYLFQPRNAVPISSWFDDPTDTELRELLPVLERAAKVENVYPVLDSYRQAIATGERWYP